MRGIVAGVAVVGCFAPFCGLPNTLMRKFNMFAGDNCVKQKGLRAGKKRGLRRFDGNETQTSIPSPAPAQTRTVREAQVNTSPTLFPTTSPISTTTALYPTTLSVGKTQPKHFPETIPTIVGG